MPDITVSYKGSSIATINASGTTTLGTSGTWMEDDVSIAYTKPVGSSWTLLGSTEIAVNQTGTSNTNVGSITVGSTAFTKDKVIWVRVRDKAGPRNGYFYGSDVMFFNANAANGSTTSYSVRAVNIMRYESAQYSCYAGAYGVWGHNITSVGKINIYARYNATYTQTINGTFAIEVYALTLPTGKTIFAS